jgi:hypothetical protein
VQTDAPRTCELLVGLRRDRARGRREAPAARCLMPVGRSRAVKAKVSTSDRGLPRGGLGVASSGALRVVDGDEDERAGGAVTGDTCSLASHEICAVRLVAGVPDVGPP